jgi:hypothetical protein
MPNATVLNGEAHFKETFVKVRWPWLIVPLLETLLSSMLLVATVIVTWKEPLFKNSVVSLLIHGLDGWSENDTDIAAPQTAEKLEKMAERMSASFDHDQRGRLKSVRA